MADKEDEQDGADIFGESDDDDDDDDDNYGAARNQRASNLSDDDSDDDDDDDDNGGGGAPAAARAAAGAAAPAQARGGAGGGGGVKAELRDDDYDYEVEESAGAAAGAAAAGAAGDAGAFTGVTVRAMSNQEVYFFLEEALAGDKGSGGGGLGGGRSSAAQRGDLEKMMGTLKRISPPLKGGAAELTALKESLEKWSAEEGRKRLRPEHIARFINFTFEDPEHYRELCSTTAEREEFSHEQLADIIDIVNKYSSSSLE